MADLTTPAKVAEYLGLTAAPAIFTRLVTAASAFIESNLNRSFTRAAYSETRSGKDEQFVTFADYPVSSVQSVTIDGIAIPAAPSQAGSGYLFDDTRLILKGYRFNRGLLNVQIAYTAGYSTIPYEVEQACIDIVARKYKERDRVGVNSKIINGETVNFSKTDMTDELKSVLRAYQKVTPV